MFKIYLRYRINVIVKEQRKRETYKMIKKFSQIYEGSVNLSAWKILKKKKL